MRKVCVIGDRVYKILFKPNENAIGEYVKINGIYLKVVGVFKLKSKDMGEDTGMFSNSEMDFLVAIKGIIVLSISEYLQVQILQNAL